MLKSIQNFLAPIAHDFAQPNAAIDGYEQGSLVQSGWLGVRGDDGVQQLVPDLKNLRLAAAPVNPQLGKHLRQHGTERQSARAVRLFYRGKIQSAPLREDALAGRLFARAKRRNVLEGEAGHARAR